MRSLLLVPADSEKKLVEAASCGADALIIDLAGSADKATARARAAELIAGQTATGPFLLARINSLASREAEADLDVIVGARPAAIALPKAAGGGDIGLLSAMIAAREAQASIEHGAIGIIALATETPGALFRLARYRGASVRLTGLAWTSDDLAAALGGDTAEPDVLTDPLRLARTLCRLAAADAGVAAIDRSFPHRQDDAGLRDEALAARRDGFAAKLASHAEQVAAINEVLPPSGFSPFPASASR